MKLWTQQNRRARQIGAPRITAWEGNVKHQVGNPVPAIVCQVPLLRQHVGHPSAVQGRQLFIVERLDTVDDLGLGKPRQYQLSPLESKWQNASCGWRIEADRTSQLGVPEFRGVEPGHPRSLHQTYETVLPFDRGFVTMPPKDQDLGILRDRL